MIRYTLVMVLLLSGCHRAPKVQVVYPVRITATIPSENGEITCEWNGKTWKATGRRGDRCLAGDAPK